VDIEKDALEDDCLAKKITSVEYKEAVTKMQDKFDA
jgi:hypothetical protein